MSMKRDGWITKCIGDCFEYIKNGANIKQEKNASGYPITRIETLANGVFNRDRMGYANIFDVGKYCINILQDQDILMSHINSKAYIGRSVIYRKIDNEIIIHGMNLLRLIAKKDFLNPYYANYYFKTDSFKGDVAKIRKDAVNQSSMAISDLSKIKMPIPPLPEQFRIVEELDQLSNIIEKKRQQLSELDNLAQSIFYDMFGDPVTNEKGWEVKSLKDIGSIITGNTPSTKDVDNYSSNDYCFVKPGDIGKDGITLINSTEYYVSEKAYLNSRKLPVGSVLVTCIGIIGKVGILLKNSICNQQINAILPNELICSEYCAFVIMLMRHKLEVIANAPVVPIINKGDFSNIRIPLPQLNFQQLFAQKIEAIEKEKELIKQSIKETEELFNSRMDYYFN